MGEPYNINFCFPVKPLKNDRVKLTPWIPSLHAEPFFKTSLSFPEIYTWLPFGPFATSTELVDYFEVRIRRDPELTLFTMLVREDGKETVAGLIGLLNTSVANLSTEIGFIFVLPPFQRRHLAFDSSRLLLAYCFDELRMRRVQWQTNALNEASRKAAERLGFKLEGIKKWERALPPSKDVAVPTREGDPCGNWGGRHTALFSMGWDEWDELQKK